MERVACTLCGAKFPIGRGNPRRACADVQACDTRRARRADEEVKSATRGERIL